MTDAADAGVSKRDIDRIGAVHRVGSLKKASVVAGADGISA